MTILRCTKSGDFYQFRGDAAKTVADVLTLTVMKDRSGESLVGVPIHCANDWFRILSDSGYQAQVA